MSAYLRPILPVLSHYSDVQFPQKQSLPIAQKSDVKSRSFTATVENGTIRVPNRTEQPLLIQSLKAEDSEELLNVVVDGGETVELHSEDELSAAELQVRVVRELDMVVPRTRCMVRHRAERYEPDLLPEIIFDLGVMLRGSSVADARKRKGYAGVCGRIRTQHWPPVISAAILVQKQQFGEAQRWLDKAYRSRFLIAR